MLKFDIDVLSTFSIINERLSMLNSSNSKGNPGFPTLLFSSFWTALTRVSIFKLMFGFFIDNELATGVFFSNTEL